MPANGISDFGAMKKALQQGREIEGQTLGIVGFGRIGQSLAQLALGAGMKVIASDPFCGRGRIGMGDQWLRGGRGPIRPGPGKVLANADFLSVHVPSLGGKPLLGAEEIRALKKGSFCGQFCLEGHYR